MKKNISIIIAMLVCIAIFIFLGLVFSSYELFKYNLMDIITTTCVSFGIYYLTKIGEEKQNKNNKVESTIEVIQKKLNITFLPPIEFTNKAEYLHTFKYLDNKISILSTITKHLKCEEEIRNIKAEKDKLEEFINENINLGNEYFIGDTVKEKIPNILCNIETHLDTISLKIYDSNK